VARGRRSCRERVAHASGPCAGRARGRAEAITTRAGHAGAGWRTRVTATSRTGERVELPWPGRPGPAGTAGAGRDAGERGARPGSGAAELEVRAGAAGVAAAGPGAAGHGRTGRARPRRGGGRRREGEGGGRGGRRGEGRGGGGRAREADWAAAGPTREGGAGPKGGGEGGERKERFFPFLISIFYINAFTISNNQKKCMVRHDATNQGN
jgi:hypothetical protein